MGRPQLFDSPEQLEALIDKYFNECDKPTLSGLAVFLGMDRKTLYNYKERPEFFPIIKKARDIVEAKYEERLIYDKNPTGVIFALKNMEWRDKQEVQQSGGIAISFAEPEEYKRLYPSQDQGSIGDLDSDQ